MRNRRTRLPNFLVIGAMKAGTTSLYRYLQSHPQVFMPSVKELAFFAKDEVWGRGIEWYEQQFALATEEVLALGEASTLYTKYPRYKGVPQRIAKHLPSVRLLYVVRDPIERIRSHYQHRVAVGVERTPMEEALLRDPIYLDCSRYALQIEQYLRYFSRDQILIVTSEALREARGPTMRRVYEFLDVDGGFVPANLSDEFYRSANRTIHSPLSWRIRTLLKTYFPQSKRAKEWFDSWGVRSHPLFPSLGPRRSLPRKQLAVNTVNIPEALSVQLRHLLGEDTSRLRAYMDDGPGDRPGWLSDAV
jgi:hypothetical protein